MFNCKTTEYWPALWFSSSHVIWVFVTDVTLQLEFPINMLVLSFIVKNKENFEKFY